jgi:hypothetical protein
LAPLLKFELRKRRFQGIQRSREAGGSIVERDPNACRDACNQAIDTDAAPSRERLAF